MTKRLYQWLLLVALIVGLSMSVTSCKDDDKTSDEEQQQKEAEEQAGKVTDFWMLVSQLTDEYDDDYEGKTFTPSIGEADPLDATTRIVYTNDMATAAQRFNYLTGAGIDETTKSYTWQDSNIGTLTYTQTNDGASWATVDVSIRQLPALKRIVYKTPSAEENGYFPGTAYYRFGDVVRRTVEDHDEYWVCVRPAFGPEDKGESHWVCLNYLPKENIFSHPKNNPKYFVPTGLKISEEHMQNLAELLYAICSPSTWEQSVNYYPKTPMFHDFHKTNLRYHTKYFWERVQNGWNNNNIWNLALDVDNQDAIWDQLVKGGLHLLYFGKEWVPVLTWNCKLWEVIYTNGSGEKEANMHKVKYQEVKHSMRDIQFDCRNMGRFTQNYLAFFDEDKSLPQNQNLRWCIRHKTGSQLSSTGRANPQQPLSGVVDVWNYNKLYGPTDLKQDPEVLTSSSNDDRAKWNLSEYRGRPHYMPLSIYKDNEGNRWIVVLPSGLEAISNNLKYELDPAPYSYLVSFEGVKFSADKAKATNLPPNPTILLKGLNPLTHHIQSMFEKDVYDATDLWSVAYRHLKEKADFDAKKFFTYVLHNTGKVFYDIQLACFGYSDPNDNKQRLMRYINHPTDDDRSDDIYVWLHYPKTPSTDSLRQKQFNANEPIHLQDMTSVDFVGYWAPDWYATRPLTVNSGGDGTTARAYRTTTDARAKDVTNYVFKPAAQQNRTWLTSMWNDPVYLMRVTRVYDRGDNDYSSFTEDNIPLRLYEPFSWKLDNEDYYDQLFVLGYISFVLDKFANTHIDGIVTPQPNWQDEVWNNNNN